MRAPRNSLPLHIGGAAPSVTVFIVGLALGAGILVHAASGHAAPALRTGRARAVSRAPVPSSLKAVESAAEDIVDAALAGNRAGVVGRARLLTSEAHDGALSALRAAGASAGQLADVVRRADRVSDLARSGGFLRIALAANAVSGVMPALYARFADPSPPAVLTLDYLDREAQLRSLAGRRDASSLVARLASTWAGLRPKVIARQGDGEASAFDAHVAAMKRLATKGGSRLRAEAVNGLNLVDELESVFA